MTEPLFLQPSFHSRIWGGRKLETVLGYQDIPAGPVGECWGISAHPNGPSLVKNGPHAGLTLNRVWETDRALFGRTGDGDFPLLVKFLDARDWLSVQVHPNDEEAEELEGVPLGKTECWYVVDAEPGAELIIGHTATNKDDLERQIDSAQWDSLLLRREVSAGDFVYVPSGTLHAVGPGLLICEVQQNCDTTYRVYDFDRRDAAGNSRELHLDKAKRVSTAPYDPATTDTAKVPEVLPQGQRQLLVDGEFFQVTRHEVAGRGYPMEVSGYELITVISGSGTMTLGGQEYAVRMGDHIILPFASGLVQLSGQLNLIASRPR